MAKTKSKTETKSGEDKKKNKLSAPSSANDKKSRANGLGKRLSQMGPDENELENDEWRCVVVMVVEGSSDYLRYTRLLQEALLAGRRRCVVCITRDQIITTIKQTRVREIPKRVTEARQGQSSKSSVATPKISTRSVMDGGARTMASLGVGAEVEMEPLTPWEEASQLLRGVGDVPPTLMAQLLRLELLRFRLDELRRRNSEAQAKLKLDSSSDFFYCDKPILNTLVDGEKERTRLRKRGCLVSKLDAIEDQPEDGPDIYVVLVGFHCAQLPGELLRAGVPLRSLVIVIEEDDQDDAIESAATRVGDVRTTCRSWLYVNQGQRVAQERAEREAAEARAQAAHVSVKSGDWATKTVIPVAPTNVVVSQAAIEVQNFWPEFEQMLWNPVYYDSLKDVTLMSLVIPRMIVNMSDEMIKPYLYDEMATVVYDIATTELLKKAYCERMLTSSLSLPTHLPRIADSQRGASLYHSAMRALPSESDDVPLRLRAMLQQVEYWLSETVRESEITSRSPSFADLSLVDVVKSELEMFLDKILQQYGQSALSGGKVKFADPLVVVEGDTVLMRAFHVCFPATGAVEVLGNMAEARLWDELPRPASRTPGDPLRHFVALLTDRLRASHGVHASSATLLLEMVAFLGLRCGKAPPPPPPRPHTPVLSSDVTSRSSGTSGSTPAAATPSSAATSASSVSSAEARPAPAPAPASAPGPAPAGTAGKAGGVRERWSGGGGNAAEQANGDEGERWDDVWSLVDEDSGEYSECRQSWQKAPTIDELHTPNDVLRFVEATLESPDYLAGIDLGTQHQEGQAPAAQAQQPQSAGQTQQSSDNVSLSNASASQVQRRLSGQNTLETPDPPGAPFALEAHRYARELSPNILLQQLFQAQVEKQCFDCQYFRPTDVLLIRAHDPVDHDGLWHWRANVSLPSSEVGLRDFHDCVMDEAQRWLAAEEEREERRRHTRALREAMSRRKMTKFPPGRGSGKRLVSAASTESASGARAAASGAAAAVDDALVDPAEFSLFALDDFLRPKSIKMALFVGNTSVRRERDRRTFAKSRAEVGEHSETPGATDTGTSTQALHKTSSKSDKSAKHSSKHKLPKDADDADATKSKEKTQGDERKKAGKSSSRGSQGQDTAQDVSEVPLAYEADEEGGSRLPRDPTLPGFELGARRLQLLSDTRRFACADGCAVSVDVDDWLHRAKNVAIKMTQGGHTLTLHHEVRAESQQRARFFNFHLTLSNGVVMAFGRTRDSPPFTRLHSPPPGAPPTSPATNTSSTTWTPSATSSDTSTACEDAAFKARVDDTFAFRLRMSWPSGLLVETVKKPHRPVYIRQRYVSKGPECTDIMEELRRCYLHDGTVLKFMRKQNRTCSMTPNGAVVISTAYDPPLFGAGMSPVPESADPTPSAAPSRSDTTAGAAGGKKRGKEQPGGRRRSRMSSPPAAGASPATTPSQAASAAHSVTIAPSTRRFAPRRSEEESAFAPVFRRRVVSLETVQPDGQRWEVQMGAGDAPATWTPTGIYIVRTHTDYEVNETLKRRGDGTVALFKPNGDLVVSFPDGTQITSGPPPAPQPSRRIRKKSSEGASMVGSLSALTAGGSSVLRSIVSSRASPATSTPSAIASAAVSTRTTPGPPTPVASETRPARPATVPTPVAAAPHTAHFTDANTPLQSRSWTAQQQPVPRIIPAMQIYTALTPASTYPILQDTPSAPRSRGRGGGGGSAGGVAKRVSVASPPEGLSAIEEEGASPSAHPLLPPEHLRLLADAERAARNAVLGRSGSSVTCFDHFEVLHSAYRIEHRNYATVEFDDTTGIVELKIPDATVQVFPDGTYHVQMPGDMHDLGDTTVTLEVGAEEIHMKHHLKESGELLCRNDIDIAFLGVPPPLAMDQVLCSTVDGVGRSFDVQYSGQSSYRRRGPGEHVVFSENARYFLVHRDLTGLELHTADALRRLIARTEEDRRSIYMSQVVVKRPDLSYHVSLRPLLSESERWLLPLPPLRLSSYEFRKRARAVAAAAAAATSSSKAVVATGRQAGDGAGEGVGTGAGGGAEQPLRSTYGVPPSWFHPFPKSASEQLRGQLERSGSHQQDSGSSGDDDEDLTAHPGMEVPDPLLVDLLKEMVPRRMRLRRVVRSAVEAIAVAVYDSEEILRERSAQRLEMREEARCDLSHVEHRRLTKRQARLSMVRPCWQEKTSSPAALNLYRLATHRRTSISMSVSEENLFQQFSVLTGAKRGHAAAKRDREAQQVQELRALLRLGRGPPYFETPAGRRFLEEDAAAHKAAAKAAARSKTLVEEASARVASAQHLLDREVGTVTPIALAPQIPTTPPTPTTPPPPPPCTTDQASFDSSHSSSSSSSSSTVCKRCGSVCEHTKRECRGETTLLGANSELSTYFPSDERQ